MPNSLATEQQIALEGQRLCKGVNGFFGQGKRRFVFDLICDKLVKISGFIIVFNLLVISLESN